MFKSSRIYANEGTRLVIVPTKDMKMHTALLMLVALAMLFTGCNKTPEQSLQDKRQGELTRELATTLLNEYLAQPSVDRLIFTNAGVQRAIQDGIVENKGGSSHMFDICFTHKGLFLVSNIVEPRDEYLADTNDQFQIPLSRPLSERVREVTGIAASGMPGISSVEYITDYIFPADIQSLAQYFYSGRKAQSAFRKYDDGWRVVPENHNG